MDNPSGEKKDQIYSPRTFLTGKDGSDSPKDDKVFMDLLLKDDGGVLQQLEQDELTFTDLIEFERLQTKLSEEGVDDPCPQAHAKQPFPQLVYDSGSLTRNVCKFAVSGNYSTNEDCGVDEDMSKKRLVCDVVPASSSQQQDDVNPLGPRPTLKFRESSRPIPASYFKSKSFGGYRHAQGEQQQAFDFNFSPANSSMHPMPNGMGNKSQVSSVPPPQRSVSCPDDYSYFQRKVHYEDPFSFQDSIGGDASQGYNTTGSYGYSADQIHSMPQYEHSTNSAAASYQRSQSSQIRFRDNSNNNVVHTGYVVSDALRGLQNRKKVPSIGSRPPRKTKKSDSKSAAQKKAAASTAAASKRSSKYRGVTRHRRSGRWEAHIWVRETGKQVYLGGYELEEHAAEAYDVAALKCKGKKVKTNFDVSRYSELIQYMDTISLEELVMAVRRQSQGFARGSSRYRGVTRHPNGRWEARIGMPGSKHIYLGLYNDEAEAAGAYDKALVKLRGSAAATNFALSNYNDELKEYHTQQQKEIIGRQVLKTASGSTGAAGYVGKEDVFDAPILNAPASAEIIAGHATRHI